MLSDNIYCRFFDEFSQCESMFLHREVWDTVQFTEEQTRKSFIVSPIIAV